MRKTFVLSIEDAMGIVWTTGSVIRERVLWSREPRWTVTWERGTFTFYGFKGKLVRKLKECIRDTEGAYKGCRFILGTGVKQ